MKNKFEFAKLIILLVVLLSTSACKKTWIMYDTSQKNHLFFYNQYLDPDSMVIFNNISFATISDNEINCRVEVKLMGDVASVDRSFDIEILKDTMSYYNYSPTERRDVVSGEQGTDYEVLAKVIPAGKVDGYIDFKLKRTDKLLKKVATVLIVIKENDDFAPRPRNAYRLVLTDGEPLCPDWWLTKGTGSDKEIHQWYQYLGDFYPDKYKMLIGLYHGIEKTNPVLFNDLVNDYGLFFEKEVLYNGQWIPIGTGFFNMFRPTVWAKYVLIPMYEYYKVNYPDRERGSGYTDKTVNATAGGWRDPSKLYR